MKKWLFILVLGILLSLTTIFLIGCGGNDIPEEIEEEQEQEEEEIEEVEKITLEKMKPICVVINNISVARPQSGLQQASKVYEFLVEGGITRLLAVFDEPYEDDFIIGPVRSLRPYFAHQAVEYGGIIAHGGYSSRTGEMISGLDLKHIGSNYFWRDSSRKAPHNLYTHMEKLRKGAGGDMDIQREEIVPGDLPDDYEEGQEIEITYSSSNKVSYVYDHESETYLRFVNGSPNMDRETDKQYYTDRVIIRKTSVQSVSGSSLVDIDLDGEGTGYLYEKGKKYSIKWEKEPGEKTEYYFADRTPVELRWGNTWIQVTPVQN